MQGMYNYVPDTNHVYRVYCSSAVLYLQFVLNVMLFANEMFCIIIIIIIIIIKKVKHPRYRPGQAQRFPGS